MHNVLRIAKGVSLNFENYAITLMKMKTRGVEIDINGDKDEPSLVDMVVEHQLLTQWLTHSLSLPLNTPCLLLVTPFACILPTRLIQFTISIVCQFLWKHGIKLCVSGSNIFHLQ